MCGFVCDTIEKLQLNWVWRLPRGMSSRRLPSLNREPPRLCGLTWPFRSFAMSTTWRKLATTPKILQLTGFMMPGTAALARMADQIRQFGAVRWLRRIVGLSHE